jgi:hypothetical protein
VHVKPPPAFALQPGEVGLSGETTAAPPLTPIDTCAVCDDTYSGARCADAAAGGTSIRNVAFANVSGCEVGACAGTPPAGGDDELPPHAAVAASAQTPSAAAERLMTTGSI